MKLAAGVDSDLRGVDGEPRRQGVNGVAADHGGVVCAELQGGGVEPLALLGAEG